MSDPTAIYIHVPFCVQKCIYCDFYSKTDLLLIPPYINCLQNEIETRAGSGDQIDTIYFGGGTPSLIDTKDINRILQTLSNRFSLARDAEITLEINPGTIDFNYLRELKKLGVTRLSIGVQSFNDEKLKFLGRIHTADQAVKAIDNAEKAGFDMISLDLIYGLPLETQGIWLQDLQKAAKILPSHLSCYMLTQEEGTPLDGQVRKGRIHLPGSAALTKLFKKTSRVLSEFKYEHYEISSFSRNRKTRSKHNSKYWNMASYCGFGAAAHSYDGEARSWNYPSIQRYIKDMKSGRLPVEDREILTKEQKMMEMILLRLRTLEGLDMIQFKTLFHISFENRFQEILTSILDASLGLVEDGNFFLTLDGKTCLNSIVEAFAKKIF